LLLLLLSKQELVLLLNLEVLDLKKSDLFFFR